MYEVEKDWMSYDLRCIVIMGDRGHRCGYVGVDENHPLFELDYFDRVPSKLITKWEEIQKEEIGKRGVVDLLCHDFDKPKIGILFDVHGGITYSGGGEMSSYPIESDLWWFGYDCAHLGDGKYLFALSETQREIESRFPTHGILRTLNYCVVECESLAKQLGDLK